MVFNDLQIQDQKEFRLLEPYLVKGYKVKNKLGKFMNGQVFLGMECEQRCLVRVIEMERISSYIIEKFQSRLIHLIQIQGIDKFWLQPIAYFVDDNMKVSIFYKKSVSLYQMLHQDGHQSFNMILRNEPKYVKERIKYEIAF